MHGKEAEINKEIHSLNERGIEIVKEIKEIEKKIRILADPEERVRESDRLAKQANELLEEQKVINDLVNQRANELKNLTN